MPMWQTPDTTAADRVTRAHEQVAGSSPTHVATAPATWSFIGEHIDFYGGITLLGLSDLQAAAAVSARTDAVVHINYNGTSSETSLSHAAELAAAQQPGIDDDGKTITPPDPKGELTERVTGMVYSMVSRQLLSRETSGLDITIVSDIPEHAGLGNDTAIDVAVALALLGHSEELNEAPLRARLADVCASSAETFSQYPALRARYTAALRGTGEHTAVVDYSDNSVTQAPTPLGPDMSAVVVTPATNSKETTKALKRAGAEIRRRQRFVQDACHAFGTESLRLLPDAPQRVIEWLNAVHNVHGPQGTPRTGEAANWLGFYEAETQRAGDFARALRSRRGADLFPILEQSQTALAHEYQLDTADKVAQLLKLRGAAGVRAASAGTSPAVIAYIPTSKAANFTADLAEDGFCVIPLNPGKVADVTA